MPLRVSNTAERNVEALSPRVIDVPANSQTTVNGTTVSGTEVLFSRRGATQKVVEMANRYIQNVGTGRLYFCIGFQGCDNVGAFHGYLEPGNQLDCSVHMLPVWGFSTTGTTVAILEMVRNDLGDFLPAANNVQ